MCVGRRAWTSVASLCFVVAALAQVPPEPAHKGDFLNGQDFRLTAVVATDAAGKPIADIPAYKLDLRDTQGNWQAGRTVTSFTTPLPGAMRSRLMLIYFGRWSLVPRDWKLATALLTDDSTQIVSFESPGGKSHGWLRDGLVICATCAQAEAAPYFARARHDALQEDALTPAHRFHPPYPPRHLIRPDGCTVVFDYGMPHSPPVREWMNYVGVQHGELHMFQIAVPGADKELRDLILADRASDPQKCVVEQDHHLS